MNEAVGLLATRQTFPSLCNASKQSINVDLCISVHAPRKKSKSKLPIRLSPQPLTRDIWRFSLSPPRTYILSLNNREHESSTSVSDANGNASLVNPPAMSTKTACLLPLYVLIAKTCVPEKNAYTTTYFCYTTFILQTSADICKDL